MATTLMASTTSKHNVCCSRCTSERQSRPERFDFISESTLAPFSGSRQRFALFLLCGPPSFVVYQLSVAVLFLQCSLPF